MRANDGTRTGGEILVDQLQIHGVEHAFCVPGESYLAALDAFHDRNIKLTVCRQEGGAAMMAEAVGKATGRPGICFVTRGPGATNASPGIHIAQQDSTPLIVFVGQVGREMKERDAFQELDYKAVFGSICKWVTEIDDPARIPELVSRAFYTATSRPAGAGADRAAGGHARRSASRWPTRRPMSRSRRGRASRTWTGWRAMLAKAKAPIVLAGGSRWSEAAAARCSASPSASSCRSRPPSGAAICSMRCIPATRAISASARIPSWSRACARPTSCC